jgi:hypothetical protein
MSELIITERKNIVAIADAVRNKTGRTDDMNLAQIKEAIEAGTGGSGVALPELTTVTFDITEGGVSVNIYYTGIDDNGAIGSFSILDATSGSFSAITGSYFEVSTTDGATVIQNNDCYVGSGGSDQSYVVFCVMNSVNEHFTFNTYDPFGGGGWGDTP